MASDRLYKLAAEFNKSQLWHEIMDYQIFGVRLPSGKIGYCSVQGFNDFQISLSVYVGAEGFATYRHSYFPTEEMTDNEYFFHSMERECLQCVFMEKDSLTKEELAEEKNFSKRNKIYFRAKKSHPRFSRCQALTCDVPIDSQEDEEILTLALEAMLEVGKKIPNHFPKKISLPSFPPIRKKFPLLTPSDGNFTWTMEWLPPYRHQKYPQAEFGKSDVEKLKKADKSKIYECELFVLAELFEDDDGVDKFPVLLLINYHNEESPKDIPMTLNYGYDRKSFAKSFIKLCLKCGVPKKILVRTERTFQFLEELCDAAEIELQMEKDLPYTQRAAEYLSQHNHDDEEENNPEEFVIDTQAVVKKIVDIVELASVEDLKNFIGEELKDGIRTLMDKKMFSPQAVEKLKQIL